MRQVCLGAHTGTGLRDNDPEPHAATPALPVEAALGEGSHPNIEVGKRCRELSALRFLRGTRMEPRGPARLSRGVSSAELFNQRSNIVMRMMKTELDMWEAEQLQKPAPQEGCRLADGSMTGSLPTSPISPVSTSSTPATRRPPDPAVFTGALLPAARREVSLPVPPRGLRQPGSAQIHLGHTATATVPNLLKKQLERPAQSSSQHGAPAGAGAPGLVAGSARQA